MNWLSLSFEELQLAVKFYDQYLEKARETDQFAKGWIPVCFNEFIEHDLEPTIQDYIAQFIKNTENSYICLYKDDGTEITIPVENIYIGDEINYINYKKDPETKSFSFSSAIKTADIIAIYPGYKEIDVKLRNKAKISVAI